LPLIAVDFPKLGFENIVTMHAFTRPSAVQFVTCFNKQAS